jgi:hypothetical protein
MKRTLAAAAALLGLLASAGQAAASGPADAALQLAAQAAAGAQGGGAQAGAGQTGPVNENIAVRVQSPGEAGAVSQSNTVASVATAANANVTGQSANQAQAGGCCAGGTQAIGQDARSSQAAKALSVAAQSGARNDNIDVRVQSPGSTGPVSQSNTALSGAAAGNANAAGQSATQSSAGGSGTQAVGQDADNDQAALAASSAEQTAPRNSNISVRVQSPGDDGDVEQSNTTASAAKAGNLNGTTQGATQAQGGSGGTQAIGQSAASKQAAGALSSAEQVGARNENVAVRVQSPGAGGSVSQSNAVLSGAAAGNLNGTMQDAKQGQAGADCRCAGGTQAIGQDATNEQVAGALSSAVQLPGHDCACGASGGNAHAPVRVHSHGGDGLVEQANTVASGAAALNLNGMKQEAGQAQSGGGIQAIGQKASSHQAALALSAALQAGASNRHTPVTVGGKDDRGKRGTGGVSQSNTVLSGAKAANANLTAQNALQLQGASCRCPHALGIQALGQAATNAQLALGASLAVQCGPAPGPKPGYHGPEADAPAPSSVRRWSC